MPSVTVENYLKRIFLEQHELDGQAVPMGRVSALLSVVPGTATTMVKHLAEAKLVEYEPRVGVRLTPEGEKLALGVIRRHRLVELFLHQVLKMDWSEVDEEAETLEHAISDRVIEKIDVLLGCPDVDPHGDPIPSATGAYAERKRRSLLDCQPGQTVRIVRVANQEPAFLQFVESSGLSLGANVSVLENNPIAQALVLSLPGGRTVSLGLAAAKKILVEDQP